MVRFLERGGHGVFPKGSDLQPYGLLIVGRNAGVRPARNIFTGLRGPAPPPVPGVGNLLLQALAEFQGEPGAILS